MLMLENGLPYEALTPAKLGHSALGRTSGHLAALERVVDAAPVPDEKALSSKL